MEVTRRDLVRAGLALSATSAVSGSAIARANTLLFTNSGTTSVGALAGIPPREQLLLDFGWKFILGSACDSLRDLGVERRRQGASCGQTDRDARQYQHDRSGEVPPLQSLREDRPAGDDQCDGDQRGSHIAGSFQRVSP